jgi:hypothetical protein
MKRTHIHIAIGVPDFALSKIVVIEFTLKLSVVLLVYQEALAVFFVFGPEAFVNLFRRLVVTVAFFHVVYPFASVKVVLVTIKVCSSSVLFSVPEIAFVNDGKLVIDGFFKGQLAETIDLTIVKLSFVYDVAGFKKVCALAMESILLIMWALVNVLLAGEKVGD